MRLVQEVLAVAQGGFRILVDGKHDRLHMVEAVAFAGTHVSDIGERLNPGRVIRLGVVPNRLHRIRRSIGPLITLSVPGYLTRCSLTCRSRSMHRSSTLESIRASSSSADLVEIPAR